MKFLIGAAWLAAFLIYLSFHGIEIGGRQYWTVVVLLVVRDLIDIWYARDGE
jgi:hypothetical protein